MAAASGSPWRWGCFLLLRHGIAILWLCVIISVFWTSYAKYKKEQKHFYLRQILGSGLCLSRGMASVLNVSCFMVMLPMCRSLTSSVRTLCSRTSMRFICFWIDASKGFHITCAVTIIVASVFHSVAHVVNALNFSRYYNANYKDINVAGFKGQDPLTMVIGTVPGITGVLMVVILCILSSSSVKYVRSTCYDIFWYTHRLFLVFLLLLLCHPMSGLLKEQSNVFMHIPGCRPDNSTNDPEVGHPEHHYNDPGICGMEPKFVPQKTETWKWITAALSVYAMDLGFRLLRRTPSVHIVAVHSCKGQLMCLKLRKEGFTARPGQFVFLQCSAVSSIEWHPFTISKCPTKTDPTFTVHVRTKGDWSNSLQHHLFSEIGLRLNDMALVRGDLIFHVPSSSSLYAKFSVDGPFSSCIEDVFRHPVSICVAGGVGITPFAALLSCFRADPQSVGKLKRLHLIWICKEVEAFCWFSDLLVDLFHMLWYANRPDLLDVQLYLTRPHSTDSLKIVLKETFPFLRPRIHFGRPQWTQLFQMWEEVYRRSRVGLFCCGPPMLSQQMRELCRKATIRECKFSFYHESFS